MRIQLVLATLLFLFTSQSMAAAPCFTMLPKEKLDDGACSPVPVVVSIVDCKDSSKISEKIDVVARFECKTRPKRLKYWHKDYMLVGELEPAKGWNGINYRVANTYALGSSEPKTQQKSPVVGAGVVGAATATANKLPTPELKANEKVAVETKSAPTSPIADAHLGALEASPVTPAVAPVAAHNSNLIEINKWKLGAMIDGYYAYNFLKPSPNTVTPATGSPTAAIPATQNTYHSYDFYHDSIMLGLAEVSVSQEAEPVGFKLDLGYGAAVDAAAGGRTDANSRNLLQGYLSYKTPIGLRFDFGKFYSHMGYEAFEAGKNANYSHSLMYTYGLPLWHNGLKVSFSQDNMWSVGVMVLNGWNNSYATNRNKTLGATISVSPIEEVGITVNYIGGVETTLFNGANVDGKREAYDAQLWVKPVDFVKLAFVYDTASETLFDVATAVESTKRVSSAAVYGTIEFLDDFSFSPRYEMFDDADAVTFGEAFVGGQKITSTTATLDYRAHKQLKLRAEYRVDVSDKTPFTDRTVDPATTTATQSTALVSAIVTL